MQRCAELHAILRNGTRFTSNDFGVDKSNKKIINSKQGVYIAFQKEEVGHGGERIVRVGETTDLYRRLRRHYGNPQNDAFGDNLPMVNSKEMKRFMVDKITFKIISTDAKPEYREVLKNKIYLTILNCEECNHKFLWQKDSINNINNYELDDNDMSYICDHLL